MSSTDHQTYTEKRKIQDRDNPDIDGIIQRMVRECIPINKIKFREGDDVDLIKQAVQERLEWYKGNSSDKNLSQISKIKNSGLEKYNPVLKILKDRFDKMNFGKDSFSWNKIQSALEANPDQLEIILKMEELGHEPGVFEIKKSVFTIGTCSQDTPFSTRNLTYQEALQQAKEMGLKLMYKELYVVLNRYFDSTLDQDSSSYILRDPIQDSEHKVIYAKYKLWNNSNSSCFVYEDNINYKSEYTGWRGLLNISFLES